MDEAEGDFEGRKLVGDLREALGAETGAGPDEGLARGFGFEGSCVGSEQLAVQALFVHDAELHRGDDAFGAHEVVAEDGCAEREEEELHGPRGLGVHQGVEEDDALYALGVVGCPVEADGAA